MLLNQTQHTEAKALLNKLHHLYEEKVEFDLMKFERESALKEELASACNIRDKEGNATPKKVKMPPCECAD